MDEKYKLNQDISNKIKFIIEDYEGGEIFFGCLLDNNANIYDIEPICYGNDEAVLAPFEIVQGYNAILHNHPSGNTKPSQNDLEYATYLQRMGIGFFITNNSADKLNTVIPPIVSKTKQLIDADIVKEHLIPNGDLSKIMDDFEFREGQLEMALKVTDSINNNKIVIIEAGTGIGKSIAYLIPAFIWAEKNNERIVISTNTINLQSQLLNKDIPIVKKILDSKLEAVIVKGRKNYLCKLKLYNVQNELEFDEDSEDLNSLLKWSATTETGSLDELNYIPNNSIWDNICSDVDFCTGSHCIFFQQCFFQKARRKSAESNILIVNHHILFADISIRSAGKGLDENILLPPYRKIIFDEAHNIENSALSFFSIVFSKSGFYKLLSLIKTRKNRGFIPKLIRKLRMSDSDELKNLAGFIEDNVLGAFNILYTGSLDIFNKIDPHLKNICNNNDNGILNKRINIQKRIKKAEWTSEKFFSNILENLRDLAIKIEDLEKAFDRLHVNFEKCSNTNITKYELDIKLIKSYKNKLSSAAENIHSLMNIDPDEYVTWIDIYGDINDLAFKLTATPLYIDKILAQNVYEVFDSIIFSSATLTVNRSFDFFKRTVGLDHVKNKDIIQDSIDSPFDYKNNVLFIAPNDIPEPKSPLYNDRTNEFLKETIKITNGSAFVLFTSYNQLTKSFEKVAPALEDDAIRCFYQGEYERSKLLDKFISEINSSLFATSSFWEGVDAPGKTLKYVILAKLPFRAPTEPIEEARAEDMIKKGINPFIEYTLPSTVIRFKQGFGRLIRKKTDYGIIAILDSRILHKFYGKIFLRSLPQCKFFSGNLEETIDSIRAHIEECEMSLK